MTKIFDRNIIIVFFMSFIFIISLEFYYKPYTKDGIHFQKWTSDRMMQTVPIKQLKEYPILSLWYLHIQPPMYDGIRTLIAQFIDYQKTSVLLEKVDETLYILFAFFYSVISIIIYSWISNLTNPKFGLLAALFWIPHPAHIFYATLLDSTLLSSFGFTWFLYEIWRLGNNSNISFLRLSLSLLFIFFTRTIFQWYFIPVLLITLFLFRISVKRIFYSSITISIIIVFLFLTKQYVLFDTLSTTTFAGWHECGMIWHNPTKDEIKQASLMLEFNYPAGAKKVGGGFNNENIYEINKIYSEVCKKYFFDNPLISLKNIRKNFLISIQEFFKPSSSYKPNVIVDGLPWRVYYDYIFSGIIFKSLIFISLFIWFLNRIIIKKNKKDIFYYIGLIIPLIYVFLIINIGAFNIMNYPRVWIPAAHRLKFIMEPVLYIFIFVQLYNLFCLLNKVLISFRNGKLRNTESSI